jgi:hypothetical protein
MFGGIQAIEAATACKWPKSGYVVVVVAIVVWNGSGQICRAAVDMRVARGGRRREGSGWQRGRGWRRRGMIAAVGGEGWHVVVVVKRLGTEIAGDAGEKARAGGYGHGREVIRCATSTRNPMWS